MAVKTTFVPAQIMVALAAMLTVGVTGDVTVIVIGLEVIVPGLAQAAVEVITTVITSLFTRPAF